ncbi:MAG: hypothetical protein HY432_00015 [Candidatus Liptonbacteria bacterium]|nr:hypothetical protein [Candidatus Liptonbacteria bacterium]
MSEELINKILTQLKHHEERISALEGVKTEPKGKKVRQSVIKGKADDLTLPIRKLFDEGFFKEARVDLEVVDELQKRLLTKKKPLRASVVNVLRKMVRNNLLERAEIARGKKNLIAYINKP